MNFIKELLSNKVLVSAFLGYFIAQVVKIIIEAYLNRTFSLWRLLGGNGGMPSSHSSTVCALAVSSALEARADALDDTNAELKSLVRKLDWMAATCAAASALMPA